ncbi:uncharacterized protein LOC112575642 [Pomacea canaliculata]|uniref:uncharacterized protein LOC112575642 n=1 Tax=Pomacea canaliculata TaxID=400727 RepID=UPI000D7362B6|nr:uncharacterized protein LOC112575642 [Pomacea canaliculata]
MSSRTCLLVAVTLATWLVETCDGDVRWTRDRKFDGLVKVNGYPHSELGGEGMNVRYCASTCTSSSRCASFFYLTANRTCIMNDLIFPSTSGGTVLPGARYFKAVTATCPVGDGYVWVARLRMCFKFYPTLTNFSTVFETCTNNGDRPVVLDTGDKNYAVSTYVAYTYGATFYVGAVREGAVNGSRTLWTSDYLLYWLNGKLVATDGPDSGWGLGHPSNSFGKEGCMVQLRNQWNDVSCDTNCSFVCEKVIP